MAKKTQKTISEADLLARMAGGFRKAADAEEPVRKPEKEKNADDRDEEQQAFILKGKETYSSGNGKKNAYEEKFLSRTIYGVNRSNVGISKETLNIAERVIARIFDNKIAISTYMDNILWEHFNRYKKEYEIWLTEKPNIIF
jgi:hypothetical protein